MLKASHDATIKKLIRKFIPARHLDLILQIYLHVIMFESVRQAVPKEITEVAYGLYKKTRTTVGR